MRTRFWPAALAAAATTSLFGGSALAGAGVGRPAGAAASASALPAAQPFATPMVPDVGAQPPTTAQCQAEYGLACYSPQQLQTAYDMASLYASGEDGVGETIVLVDSYGSPTIASDLASFDQGFGLPAPPSLKIITPAGPPPAFHASNGQMVAWAQETSLDVEYAHAMAPGANLLLVETPSDETVGRAGFPDIVKAEKYVIQNHLGDVISQSFGAPEQTFPSAASIERLRGAYKMAAQDGVTVLAATGDQGASGVMNAAETEFFTSRVVDWPASDPLVTAVGGTQLHLNASGKRTAPDNVWNDTARLGSPAAGGGGVSTVFARPAFQSSVASVVGSGRGLPDVALSAAVNGAALVYTSFSGFAGYSLIGGTSEATPLFAGIVAIADQAAGHDLGDLNTALYGLAAGSPGLPDITKGNNTVSFEQGGQSDKVKGFTAKAGYDVASGLGSVDGADLVAELAAG